MKVVEAIAQAVVAEGVSLAFNVPDEITVFLAHELQSGGVRLLRPRHEQNAIAMADAYSRSSGEVAVCLVGAGPAIAQTGTGFMTASRRGSPVLVIIAQPKRPGDVKLFDARRYVESVGGRFVPIRGSATVADDVREGFRQVRLRQGPVVLEIPDLAMLTSDVPDGWAYQPSARTLDSEVGASPDSAGIQAAARWLLEASRPIILAGRGAVLSGARDELVRLAERTGALLGTSLQGRGYFAGHPLDIGIIGGFAAPGALAMLAEADCVLAVGMALNPYQLGHVTMADGCRIVQFDRNQGQIGAITPVALGIVSDARAAASAINARLDSVPQAPASQWTAAAVRRGLDDARAEQAPPADKAAGDNAAADTPAARSQKLAITTAVSMLDSLLPADRMVVIDGGLFMYFAVDGISVPTPESFVWTLDFGTIGLGLPMGIGTALARPDRRCVVVAGDGGLVMSTQEMETAVREGVSLIVVVLNDAAYGAEVRFLEANDKPGTVAVFDDIDFASVARAFGGRGVTVRTHEDFAAAAKELSDPNGLLVIDVKVAQEEHHRYLGFLEVMAGAARAS